MAIDESGVWAASIFPIFLFQPNTPTTSNRKTTTTPMIAVIQRVSSASVTIEKQIKGQINAGFLVLLGITHTDTDEDVAWLAKKIVGLRVFGDADEKMNLDLKAIDGNILLISQFTLHASTKKGNRPSFIEAARPEVAIPLYEKMIDHLSTELGQSIQTGEFGADMKVALLNDGPVTIVIDSKNRI
jgi:D-aminoacyl-tRNA deacylase